MNLKKNKFLQHIQKLRRVTNERRRLDNGIKEPKVDVVLHEVFKESSGGKDCMSQYSSNEETVRNYKTHARSGFPSLRRKREPHFSPRFVDLEPTTRNDDDGGMPQHPLPEINSLIQLNNMYFRIKCPLATEKTDYSKDGPTISSTKSSICTSQSRYSMIGRIARMIGYSVVKESKLWNIMWTDVLPGLDVFKQMKRFQQINHFPGMMEICRKDLLSRNLNRMLKLFPNDYKIFPKTWVFPADLGDCLSYVSRQVKPKFFIIKPDSGAQGRGIWLTNDIKSINPTERMICQTYVHKPLLIDGYKFDLRVYVLITSVDPLRIFVYNEGLARFATSKYVEPTSNNNHDLFMHLTNYSVNKRSSQYELCDNDDCGSKRKLSAINKYLKQNGYDIQLFWSKIDDIIIKTVLSAWPMLKHNYHACFPSHDKIQACFEILGFDILVDSKLRPYILEVNHSPSFHTNEQVDRQVKRPLIRDTLTLVSTALADKKQIMREDRKRVKQRLLMRNKGGESTYRPMTSNKSNANDVTSSDNNETTDSKPDYTLSPLAQQIAWEESHLGNFRRIMPPQQSEKINYYCQFFALQNQASVYGDTAASKKREEFSKKLRMQLEEKRAKELEMLKSNAGRLKFEDRRQRRAALPRQTIEKQRLARTKFQANWTPDFISEAEERLRRSWWQMRTDEIKDLKLVETVYMCMYNADMLTNSDIVTYPKLFKSLKAGINIVAQGTL